MANRRRLRNVLQTETRFKLLQVARMGGFVAVYLGVSTAVLAVLYVQLVHPELAGEGARPAGLGDLVAIWRELPGLRRVLGVFGVGMLGISALFAVGLGLHLGHTVAGPIHRLRSELERIGRGEPIREITLRDSDAFQDVARALNDAFRAVRNDEAAALAQLDELEQLRDVHAALRERLDGFRRENLCPDDAARVQSLCEGLYEILAKTRSEASSPLVGDPAAAD